MLASSCSLKATASAVSTLAQNRRTSDDPECLPMQTFPTASALVTQFYEIHYVFKGAKEVLVVEKANMGELDAWLCMLIFISPKTEPFNIRTVSNVDDARNAGVLIGLSRVRWNKVGKFDRRRASIFFYGETLASGLYRKTAAER